MMQVRKWAVFEASIEAERDYANPTWDVNAVVRFTAPSGRQHVVDAFWDSGRLWRVRFCPEEEGQWHWRSECPEADDAGLHGQHGRFQCVGCEGENPLYAHGTIRLSEDRRHFVHADGTPFFWLADTAWNGVIRSSAGDWDIYLRTRRRQGFTAVQFVSTHWRGGTRDPHGETAVTGTRRARVNPAFFRRLDPKVAAINERGLVAVPVILWALGEEDPGQALPEEGAVRLARYVVARWGAYQVVWLLGGDGDYRGDRAERWRRIGRAVFGTHHDRLVSMHPCGQQWVADEFRREPWYDFVGYQSGHGDSPEHLRWLALGRPAEEWQKEPPRPIVNLEPNYEAHPSYHSRRRFTDREVRRAAYWSLLNAPTAGLTFGHNSIWVWADAPEVPEGHPRIGTVDPWHAGLDTPGAASMAVLKRFFSEGPWWRLRPAQELLTGQPGEREPRRYVAAARTADGVWAVLYMPEGGAVSLRTESLKRPTRARWFDPAAGRWTDAGIVTEAVQSFTAPDRKDWLLELRSQELQ